MDDHVIKWLGAYLDGELHGERLQQVKTHLLACAICQEELAGLQRLSGLLRQVPPVVDMPSANQFVPQVLLRLPSRSQTVSNRILKTSWSLVPVVLLAALVFFQTVWVVNGLVLLTGQTGLFNNTFAWIGPGILQGTMTAGIAYLLNAIPGQTGQALFEVFHGGEWLNSTILIPLSIQASLMLLFASWLASWFVHHQSIPNRAGWR